MAAAQVWPPLFDLDNTGRKMPAIGFGPLPETCDRETTMTVIDFALKAGYRSFETTALSETQTYTGEALKACLPRYDLKREDIFLSAKLYNAHRGGKQRITDGLAKSESSLESSPDLYIIHFPPTVQTDVKNKKIRHAAWGAITSLHDTGLVESIGLTNFSIKKLKKLYEEYRIDVPMLNQVEWNPLNHDECLLNYCQQNSIILQGTHSLGDTSKQIILKNTLVKEIADDNAASPAQVLLRWSLQKGVAIIPKSTNAQHILENMNINFSLNIEQLNALEHLSIAPVKFKNARHKSIR